MIILGLGSNLGDRLANMRQALKLISAVPEITVRQVAPVYESNALLLETKKAEWNLPFLNSAVSCVTTLAPLVLLNKLKVIEKVIGRPDEYEKWSPRLIDIDILVWNSEIITTERLTVPQKDLANRPFAMWPIADLAPDWQYLLAEEGCESKTAKEVVQKWGSRFDGDTPLHTKQIAHRIDGSQIVGVLNVGPDSFSDGGDFSTVEKAVNHCAELFHSGADIIDIGAESTRPGGVGVSAEQEWQRLGAILTAINSHWQDKGFKPKLSVDTRHWEVAEQALELGVDWINDVTGFADSKMVEVVKTSSVKLVFMHSLAIPVNSKIIISQNEDVIELMNKWASERIKQLEMTGVAKERLIFDPGVGFGKSAAQSFMLVKRFSELSELGLPILIGHSRKSFLTQFTSRSAKDRDVETIAMCHHLEQHHVDYVRVHNVDWYLRTKRVTQALAGGFG